MKMTVPFESEFDLAVGILAERRQDEILGLNRDFGNSSSCPCDVAVENRDVWTELLMNNVPL